MTVAVCLAGCGYMGGPLPPLANVPERVTDLAAVQRGSKLMVRFTVPKVTTEGMPIRSPLALDLRISAEGKEEHIPPAPVHEGVALYELSTLEWTGKEIAIAVRVTGENGKEAGWSDPVVLRVVPPPSKPAAVRAEPTAAGVHLTWSAPGDHFRIFRKTGDEPFAPVANVQGHREWTDPETEFGKSYVYLVQEIVEVGNNHEAESEPSEPASVTPRDTFPPAVPTGLNAAIGPNSVELSWDRNPEPDLAGYRLYRGAPGSDFQKLADISLAPSFSDRTAEPGKTYRYAVSAVDQNGNESERSAAVEAVRP